MRRVAVILSIVFIVLIFAIARYVLFNNSMVNAGYAAVLLVFALVSVSFCRKTNKKHIKKLTVRT